MLLSKLIPDLTFTYPKLSQLRTPPPPPFNILLSLIYAASVVMTLHPLEHGQPSRGHTLKEN